MGKKLDQTTMIRIVSLKNDRKLKNKEIAEIVGFDASTVSRVMKTYEIVKNRDYEGYKQTDEELRKNLEGQIRKWCEFFEEDPNHYIALPVAPDPDPEEPEQMSIDEIMPAISSSAEKLLNQILHFVISIDKTLTKLSQDERINKFLEVLENEE